MTYPHVRLSEIAAPITRTIPVVPGNSYRTLGVRWWGGGAYERQTIDGSQTAAKTLSVVHEGDLIINKIWVRHGSTAVASRNVDGCAASGEFPTFVLDPAKVSAMWLHWLTKTQSFWSKCDALSRGTSGKNRIKPELFLSIEIPLPPLSEQQRIITRIEELASKIEEARGLRDGAVEAADALLVSSRQRLYEDVSHVQLGELVLTSGGGAWGDGDDPDGAVVLRANNITGQGQLLLRDMRYRAVREDVAKNLQLRNGDIIMTKSNSIEIVGNSAIFMQPPGDERVYIASNFLHFIRLNLELCDPRYVWNCLMSPSAQDYYRQNASGTSPSLQNLNATKISRIQVPLPPLDEQKGLVAHLEHLRLHVEALRRLQDATSVELAALLPAVLDKAFKGEL